jgi:hypothetical protein
MLVEEYDRFNAFQEILYAKTLVWRMDRIGVKSQAKKNGIQAKFSFK